MSFSFNDSLGTTRDVVRAKIGDTDADRALLTDEAIDKLLNDNNQSIPRTCIDAVRIILATFTRNIDRSMSGLSSSVDQVTAHYRALLEDLEKEAATNTGVYPGAIKVATLDDLQKNQGAGKTYVPPDFSTGMFDNTTPTAAETAPDWSKR